MSFVRFQAEQDKEFEKLEAEQAREQRAKEEQRAKAITEEADAAEAARLEKEKEEKARAEKDKAEQEKRKELRKQLKEKYEKSSPFKEYRELQENLEKKIQALEKIDKCLQSTAKSDLYSPDIFIKASLRLLDKDSVTFSVTKLADDKAMLIEWQTNLQKVEDRLLDQLVTNEMKRLAEVKKAAAGFSTAEDRITLIKREIIHAVQAIAQADFDVNVKGKPDQVDAFLQRFGCFVHVPSDASRLEPKVGFGQVIGKDRWMSEIEAKQIRQLKERQGNLADKIAKYEEEKLSLEDMIELTQGLEELGDLITAPDDVETSNKIKILAGTLKSKEVKAVSFQEIAELEALPSQIAHLLSKSPYSTGPTQRKQRMPSLVLEIARMTEKLRFTKTYPKYTPQELEELQALPKQITELTGNKEFSRRTNPIDTIIFSNTLHDFQCMYQGVIAECGGPTSSLGNALVKVLRKLAEVIPELQCQAKKVAIQDEALIKAPVAFKVESHTKSSSEDVDAIFSGARMLHAGLCGKIQTDMKRVTGDYDTASQVVLFGGQIQKQLQHSAEAHLGKMKDALSKWDCPLTSTEETLQKAKQSLDALAKVYRDEQSKLLAAAEAGNFNEEANQSLWASIKKELFASNSLIASIPSFAKAKGDGSLAVLKQNALDQLQRLKSLEGESKIEQDYIALDDKHVTLQKESKATRSSWKQLKADITVLQSYIPSVEHYSQYNHGLKQLSHTCQQIKDDALLITAIKASEIKDWKSAVDKAQRQLAAAQSSFETLDALFLKAEEQKKLAEAKFAEAKGKHGDASAASYEAMVKFANEHYEKVKKQQTEAKAALEKANQTLLSMQSYTVLAEDYSQLQMDLDQADKEIEKVSLEYKKTLETLQIAVDFVGDEKHSESKAEEAEEAVASLGKKFKDLTSHRKETVADSVQLVKEELQQLEKSKHYHKEFHDAFDQMTQQLLTKMDEQTQTVGALTEQYDKLRREDFPGKIRVKVSTEMEKKKMVEHLRSLLETHAKEFEREVKFKKGLFGLGIFKGGVAVSIDGKGDVKLQTGLAAILKDLRDDAKDVKTKLEQLKQKVQQRQAASRGFGFFFNRVRDGVADRLFKQLDSLLASDTLTFDAFQKALAQVFEAQNSKTEVVDSFKAKALLRAL